MNKQTTKDTINTLHILQYNVFYSVKLLDYSKLLNIKFTTVHNARLFMIVLFHVNSYTRALQTDFVKLYGLKYSTALNMLTLLLDHGFVKVVPCRRKTNIGYFVKFKSYQITPLGKTMVKSFNALISAKISKLSK